MFCVLQDKEAEGAFKEWLKLKYVQKRREKVSEDQKKREFDEGWYERPRDDCDKAFRQYVFKEYVENLELHILSNKCKPDSLIVLMGQ